MRETLMRETLMGETLTPETLMGVEINGAAAALLDRWSVSSDGK